MSNIIDLNVNHNADIFRVAYKWGENYKNKLDTYFYDYDEAKKTITEMKLMCKTLNMNFELVVFEKFEIRSKNLANEIK